MTLPIVKRYLIAFEQYKWAGLATFMVALGASGVAAMLIETPPTPPYKASGLMIGQSTPISFSQTTLAIQEQGQQLSAEMLLPPTLLEPIVKQFNLNPKDFKKNFSIKVDLAKAAVLNM